VGRSLFTRSGVMISAGVHGTAALLVVLITGARPFDSEATEAISVDIVSPSEAPPVPDAWALPPEQSFEPPKPKLDMAALAMTPRPMPTPSPPQPEAKPAETTAKAQREARRSEASASSPVKGQEFSKAPPTAAQAPPPQMKGAATDGGMGGDHGTEKQANVANMFSMPLALPDGSVGGAFDSPATETAQIERNSIDAFRERIKACAPDRGERIAEGPGRAAEPVRRASEMPALQHAAGRQVQGMAEPRHPLHPAGFGTGVSFFKRHSGACVSANPESRLLHSKPLHSK
jgi:hypothetical protein